MGETCAMGYITNDEIGTENDLHKIFETKDSGYAWNDIDNLWMFILFSLIFGRSCNEESEVRIIEYKNKTAPSKTSESETEVARKDDKE